MSEQFHRIEDISFPRKVYGFGGYTNFSVRENNYSPKSVVSKKVYYSTEFIGHEVTTENLKISSYRDESYKVHCFIDNDEDSVSYPIIPFTDNSTLCTVGTEVSCGSLWGNPDEDADCPGCKGSKSYGTNGWVPEIDLYLWNAEPNVEYELIAQWGCYRQWDEKVNGVCESYSECIGEERYKVVFKIPQNLFKETRRVETFSFPYGFKDTVKYYSPNVVRLTIGEVGQWMADKHSGPMIKVGYKGTLKYTEDWDWGDGPGY